MPSGREMDENARLRDDRAEARDRAAEERDAAAEQRAVEDRDAWKQVAHDRWHAAEDRDAASADRAALARLRPRDATECSDGGDPRASSRRVLDASHRLLAQSRSRIRASQGKIEDSRELAPRH